MNLKLPQNKLNQQKDRLNNKLQRPNQPKLKLKLNQLLLRLKPLKLLHQLRLQLLLLQFKLSPKLKHHQESSPLLRLKPKLLKCKLKWTKLSLPLTRRELNNRKHSKINKRVMIQPDNFKDL